MFMVSKQGDRAASRGLAGKRRPNHRPAADESVRLQDGVGWDLSATPLSSHKRPL